MSQKSQGKRAGRGTHGSLTKAGKVREQTPIKRQWGDPKPLGRKKRSYAVHSKPASKKKPGPRISNRRAYQKSLRSKLEDRRR